jgi:TolB-like protein/DNA-binding winged helix-turn-helix (wHTH) protein/Tfp pilus assembly protein PilF
MPPTASRLVRFGSFEVDTRTGELRKGGARVKLQEKPFQLLVLLLENPGDIVTRETVRRELWPSDTFVDFDHSLGTALAKLRSALGDSARNPRFVETLAGRGYRFIAPLRPSDTPLPQLDLPPPAGHRTEDLTTEPAVTASPFRRLRWFAGSMTAGFALGGLLLALLLGFDVGGARTLLRRQSTPPMRSVAVLPLQNLSHDPSQEYFVDGMTEQLITTLAEVQGLQVISRTSAMQYKATTKGAPEIGRELHVDALVEGSVMRSGQRVRISAQLIDARTDQHLWAQSYERDLGDVLSLQNEIARSIAGEIRAQLAPAPPSQPARHIAPAAQEAYLRGRYHLNKGDESEIRKSLDDFNEALANDPEDARSYAGLASAFIALTDYYERPARMMPRARAAAQNAVKLDGSLSEAHACLGAVRFLYDWDWRGAEEELKRAIQLNDASAEAHVWYGVYLAEMGRFDEARVEMQRAESLDPLSVTVHVNAGWVFFLARQNDRATEQWRKALDLEPNLSAIHTSIWLAYVQGHQPGTVGPAVKEDTGESSALDLATLAGIYAMSGQHGKAEHALGRLEELSRRRYVCSYEIATAYAALGRRDSAIQWLRRGLDDRSICMPDIKTDPRLDGLRTDARFADLLRDVGFSP